MKKKRLFLILLCTPFILLAQQDAWVYLKDKQDVTNSVANPISILTQKAIDRKNRHNIVIDTRDVPVNETYISQLKGATGISVFAKSKWFNAVHVRGTETNINNLLINFSFVDHIEFADKSLNVLKKVKHKQQSKFTETLISYNYGSAANQVQMIKGDQLHLLNYTGTGMTMAVIDAGFPNVNTMSGFQRLRNANNILGTYDFVGRDNDVYTNTTSNHGTLVLSTIAGYVENQFVGTAPDASFYLFITEDGLTENPVEESYWVEAAERADSLGVDVINSSLGYTMYDNPNYSHANADMNGNTTFITKGANIAFEKGMLIVNSAGNSGNDSWGIVGAPADAVGVFSIGAVRSNGTYAAFSSRGNNTQPTLKPDVVAQGQASVVITENDIITTANGTSFSSPIVAGGIICLWQSLPNKTNAEIMQLVRESASQYNAPDYFLGYGVPNLEIAMNKGLDVLNEGTDNLKIYPNPVYNELYFTVSSGELASLYIFDVLGKLVVKTLITHSNRIVNVSSLSKGMYIVKLQSSNELKSIKLIKK
ncbi:S8 family serine peptidase [Mariniflexile litorale]|uniref:S8 family serine peptidase n=1 Tax=Mariniflexile litorale TaxID=3045158 RepID=A0AAU7EET5_9FLAO|nr:S8 family serine peptidase [Mariniflexile sp. KMM 9835]MDQ8211613.1 S8 family serine peptidase [Mariniflexile sp. KMM 9835]